MLGNIFTSRMNTIVSEIVNAHSRCNPHAKHIHVSALCKCVKSTYICLKRAREQRNIEEILKCYIHIQYADRLIKEIYDILDNETIEEYEIYRDSVKQTIVNGIDYWIDSSFNT